MGIVPVNNNFVSLSTMLLLSILCLFTLPVMASPENGKLHLYPLSDTYILKDCSTCRMFDESELRVGYVVKRIRLDYLPAVKYKIVFVNQSNILLKFNLSKIPPGAEIKIARLWLYVKNPPERRVSLYLYALKEEYNESWVSWTQRTMRSIWRTPGGYSEPNYIDKVQVSDKVSEGRSVGFLVTDYVKRVHSGEIEDFGVVIRPDVKKVSESEFRSSSVLGFHVDFFSLEGSKREFKSRYAPDLYVEFVKPTAIMSLSSTSAVLEKGGVLSLTASESGTFGGTVELAYRVVEAPGLKVGPLSIEIGQYDKKPGFSTNVKISAKENALPGKYVIEFYPVTPGYDSDAVEYGKVNLTVEVKGGEEFTPTATETVTESTTTTEVTNTTSGPPIPTTTTQPPTSALPLTQPPTETSPPIATSPLTTTTIRVTTSTPIAGPMISMPVLAVGLLVIIAILALLLYKRRS